MPCHDVPIWVFGKDHGKGLFRFAEVRFPVDFPRSDDFLFNSSLVIPSCASLAIYLSSRSVFSKSILAEWNHQIQGHFLTLGVIPYQSRKPVFVLTANGVILTAPAWGVCPGLHPTSYELFKDLCWSIEAALCLHTQKCNVKEQRGWPSTLPSRSMVRSSPWK